MILHSTKHCDMCTFIFLRFEAQNQEPLPGCAQQSVVLCTDFLVQVKRLTRSGEIFPHRMSVNHQGNDASAKFKGYCFR